MNFPSGLLISKNDQDWCQEQGVLVTAPGQPDYPEEFYDLPKPPPYLFYRGRPIWKTSPLLSVVGSRHPQVSSLTWLENTLGDFLHHKDVAIVSGGARGIDQKAHQMALRLGRPTVVFVPSGLQNLYPEVLQEWVDPVLKNGGAFVSPFLPSLIMRKGYFRERNLLIAALSPMTLVVECRRRSGTLLTANCATQLEREVGVMPTFPGEAGMGGLDLICDGSASIIRDAEDLVGRYNSAMTRIRFQKPEVPLSVT